MVLESRLQTPCGEKHLSLLPEEHATLVHATGLLAKSLASAVKYQLEER